MVFGRQLLYAAACTAVLGRTYNDGEEECKGKAVGLLPDLSIVGAIEERHQQNDVHTSGSPHHLRSPAAAHDAGPCI